MVSVFQVSPTKKMFTHFASLLSSPILKGVAGRKRGTVRQPRTEVSKGQKNGRQK